jgi:GT2 family glycosyltransferase
MSGCSILTVVVNWNSGPLLDDCLKSISRMERDFDMHTVVVDNDSMDSSELIVDNYPDVTLLRSGGNVGFGKACNLGANLVNSDYVLFLNPDAAVLPESVARSLRFMQTPKNANVGICGIQLLDESGHVARSCSRFPTPIGFVIHSMGLDRIFSKLGHFMTEWPHDKTQYVDHVIGAFFLVRRELFKSLNGFDERFFVYLEDLDFSYRAKQAGWRSIYLAEAQAFHIGGGTSDQVKAKRLFYSLRSRLLYSFKHFKLPGSLLVLICTLLLEPISRSLFAVGRFSWTSFAETWSGYGMLYRWLPHWLLKGVAR